MRNLQRLAPLVALVILGACGTVVARRTSDLPADNGPPAPPARRSRIALRSCQLPSIPDDARCGTHIVFEDPQARSGRTLTLHVAILPAFDSVAKPDPLFILAGGPGQAPSELADYFGNAFIKVRRDRDLVLVDLRGTGRSSPLDCQLYDDVPAHFGELYPSAVVQRCRAQHERATDLRRYTTSIMADDLDEVRDALGYDRINLYGTSYGSRVALVYLKQHGDRARSVVLKSVAPMDMRVPMSYARDAERALRFLFADCKADAKCAESYPRLEEEFRAVLARVDRGEGRLALSDSASGTTVPVTISRGAFTTTVMSLLQSVGASARLPALVHWAYRGEYAPLAQTVLASRRALGETISMGMHFSVLCTEDAPMLDSAAAAREGADSFLRDYRVQQQRAACAQWPRGTLPLYYYDPVRSEAPVLIVSGMLDPNTPEAWGEAVKRHLPNARHVVVRNLAHSFNGLSGCAEHFIADFIARASTAKLDTSCTERIARPAWQMP